MKFTFVNLTAISIIVILFASACNNANQTNDVNASTKNSNQTVAASGENANSANDDIDELGKIIKLPLLPEEANYWEETSTEKSREIVAVLKFSPENAAQLVSHIEKINPPFDSQIDAESRFPAELVAQSQLSGDETLKGKSYAADDFLQPPYKSGKVTRIENTDYFVVELTTN